MPDPMFQIRHGQFHDVDGPSRRHNNVTFVPARITLNGDWFESAFDLADWMKDAPTGAAAIVRPGDDAPWVLGRLMRLFATQPGPEDERPEKSCFFASFLAVLHGNGNLAVPFECSDYYGKSALTFSTDDPPAPEIQEHIARAFWDLLLSEPTDVADYENKMYHSGAGVWIRFGIEDGEPFMIEVPDA
jgi:hypothetical protein